MKPKASLGNNYGALCRRRLEALCRRGNAGKLILPFSEMVEGEKVVLLCPVSGKEQERGHNHQDQERWLRKEVEARGGTVLKSFPCVGSRFSPFSGDYLKVLMAAVRFCRKHKAVLLAESTDRFVRHGMYHSDKPKFVNLQATDSDLEELAFWTSDIELMTYLDPDASPSEVRSHQRKRGQWAKGNKGGRPERREPGYKKRERIELFPEVVSLHRLGYAQREISRLTGIPQPTVLRWIKRSKTGELAR